MVHRRSLRRSALPVLGLAVSGCFAREVTPEWPVDIVDATDAVDAPDVVDVIDVPIVRPPTPRPLAPLSTSAVTSHRPVLRWAPLAGSDGTRVQLCADRACAHVVETLDVTGTSATPTSDLPQGVVYWNLRGRTGSAVATDVSPTWEMMVGSRNTAVNTSSGTTLDVNGDGLADVAIGQSSGTGAVDVFFGTPTGIASTPTTLVGTAGWASGFGSAVVSAGDVNGDGYGDLLIGAFEAQTGLGAVFVFQGGPLGVAAAPTTTLRGMHSGDALGSVVLAAGDVNGDGYGDVATVIAGTQGVVYAGSADGVASTPSWTLDGIPGTATGPVVNVGDVDGDGTEDLLFSEFLYTRGLSVRTHLGTTSSAGAAVGGGDLNGDGYSDIVGGARLVGQLGVFLGGPTGPSVAPDAVYPIVFDAGNSLNAPILHLGDVNGDGFGDLAVRTDAPGGSAAQQVAVYLGAASGLTVPAVAVLTAANGLTFWGTSIGSSGDVNGDGFADLVIGATGATVNAGSGHAYVYRGSATGIDLTPMVSLQGTAPFDNYGSAVAVLGRRRPWLL